MEINGKRLVVAISQFRICLFSAQLWLLLFCIFFSVRSLLSATIPHRVPVHSLPTKEHNLNKLYGSTGKIGFIGSHTHIYLLNMIKMPEYDATILLPCLHQARIIYNNIYVHSEPFTMLTIDVVFSGGKWSRSVLTITFTVHHVCVTHNGWWAALRIKHVQCRNNRPAYSRR